MLTAFNLNDRIKVKLNKWGFEIWKNDHERHNFIASETFETIKQRYTDDKGYSEFQTWDFMRIFGQHFTMGFNQPLEDMNVFVDVEESYRPFSG